MKRKMRVTIIAVVILTMSGTAFAGPHGGGSHPRGGEFRLGRASSPGRGSHHGGIPHNSRPPHIGNAGHHFSKGPRPGTDKQFGRGPCQGDRRPTHVQPREGGIRYTIEDNYSESYSDNGYVGNDNISAAVTILSSIFGMAQNMRNSNYVAQEEENITYITPNMESGSNTALKREDAKNGAQNPENFKYAYSVPQEEKIEPNENQ